MANFQTILKTITSCVVILVMAIAFTKATCGGTNKACCNIAKSGLLNTKPTAESGTFCLYNKTTGVGVTNAFSVVGSIFTKYANCYCQTSCVPSQLVCQNPGLNTLSVIAYNLTSFNYYCICPSKNATCANVWTGTPPKACCSTGPCA